MSTRAKPADIEEIEYPDSDGEPLSDNTEQFEWIMLVKGELDAIYKDDPNVFVAGDLLWYPVKGRPDIRRAPDAMVAFGRPKGYRGSYKQWEEGDIAPQVAFEILSPKNTPREMRQKRAFYEQYEIEEYYEYDPERKQVRGWQRSGTELKAIPKMDGWVSPRLQIRFEIAADSELKLYRPDGREFNSHVELDTRAQLAEENRRLSELRAVYERERAILEAGRAEQEWQRAEQERIAKEAERHVKEAAWAKLRELGIDPEKL